MNAAFDFLNTYLPSGGVFDLHTDRQIDVRMTSNHDQSTCTTTSRRQGNTMRQEGKINKTQTFSYYRNAPDM